MTDRRPKQRFRIAAFVTAAVALAFSGVRPAAGDDLELAVKAAYLTKFGDFVEWPPENTPAAGFNLCVVGSQPFGDLIDRAARGQTVHAHPIVLQRLPTLDDPTVCQLAFIAESSPDAVARTLRQVRGYPVLTVTDRQQTADSRGIINFVIQAGRLRFAIDRGAATANHLVISSKLLDLAIHVQD